MCKLLLHQLFMHFLLLLHLLGGHADFVVHRLDFRQLPGRLQLDGDEKGTIQRLSEFTAQHFCLDASCILSFCTCDMRNDNEVESNLI